MAPSAIAAVGAFLSGAGSVLGAIWVVRAMRKRLERECIERLELLREGIRIGKEP